MNLNPESRHYLRQWALKEGLPITRRARIPERIRLAYIEAHKDSEIAKVIEITDKHIVVMCPYCGNAHYHGVGKSEKPILGTRVPHCIRQHKTQYTLVLEDAEQVKTSNK